MQIESPATTPAAPAVHDFAERRRVILARLDELAIEEGAAMLDGGKFNRAPVDRLRAELEAIDAAEGESVRREHTARAADAAVLRAEQSRKMLAFEQQRLDALDVAERAAHDLCRALEEAKFCADTIHKLGVALELRRALPMLDFSNRISRRLSHALKPLTGVGLKYGHLTFREALSQERGPWREGEAKLMREFLPTVNEDTTNGN